MTLVVDASVAVKWFVQEPGNEEARRFLSIPDPLIAPDGILAEAANTFWKKVKRSGLLIEHAEWHLHELPECFESLTPASDLITEALRLSFRLRHPVYDCLYLALALQEDCRLVTADEDFSRAVTRAGLEAKLEPFA